MGVLVRDALKALDHDELVKLRNDLNQGGIHLKNLVDHHIKMIEKEHEAFCTTCMSPIDLDDTNTFTLVFGPEDFRKKATFCAIDCLEYFLAGLKESRKGETKDAGETEHDIRVFKTEE